MPAEREPHAAGITEVPQVLAADAGYWHQQQMERIVDRGIPLLVPPDAESRKGKRPGSHGGLYAFMRRASWRPSAAASSTASARRSSSRSSPTPSSTSASTASDEEAEPPSARNGD